MFDDRPFSLVTPVGVGIDERNSENALRMHNVSIQITRIFDELRLTGHHSPGPAAVTQRHNAEFAALKLRRGLEQRVNNAVDERRVLGTERGRESGLWRRQCEHGERHVFCVAVAAHVGNQHRVSFVRMQQTLMHVRAVHALHRRRVHAGH